MLHRLLTRYPAHHYLWWCLDFISGRTWETMYRYHRWSRWLQLKWRYNTNDNTRLSITWTRHELDGSWFGCRPTWLLKIGSKISIFSSSSSYSIVNLSRASFTNTSLEAVQQRMCHQLLFNPSNSSVWTQTRPLSTKRGGILDLYPLHRKNLMKMKKYEKVSFYNGQQNRQPTFMAPNPFYASQPALPTPKTPKLFPTLPNSPFPSQTALATSKRDSTGSKSALMHTALE